MKRRVLAVFLTVMLVASAVPFGPIGAASAATEYQYTDSPHSLKIDTSGMSGSFTVEVSTSGSPLNTNTIYQQDWDASEIKNERLIFYNLGAYENLTVAIEGGSGDPQFGTGSQTQIDGSILGSTGGDADLNCDYGEQLSNLVRPHVPIIDCTPNPGSTTVSTTDQTDTAQIEIDTFEAGLNSYTAMDDELTSINNDLNDAQTVAFVKGKNAYIRSLNNGSSESAARSEAKQAIDSYYTRHQRDLFNTWNRQVLTLNRLNTTGVQEGTARKQIHFDLNNSVDDKGYLKPSDYGTESDLTNTVSLIRAGESMEVYQMYLLGDSNTQIGSISGPTEGADRISVTGTYLGGTDKVQINDTSSSRETTVINFARYEETNELIISQSESVKGEMDTLVNNTYSEYQAGEINNTDLMDPYVAASEFSPGDDYQGWAAMQLTLLGTNSPDAMDNIGRFNITTESGTDYTGILMSQSNPASGSFENGTTYDPTAVSGTQYVITSDDTHELTENFTIKSITTSSGESRENVTIVEKHYKTTNTTELKQLYEELALARAEIEAREQALGGGGGGPLENNSTTIIIVAGVAALILLKD